MAWLTNGGPSATTNPERVDRSASGFRDVDNNVPTPLLTKADISKVTRTGPYVYDGGGTLEPNLVDSYGVSMRLFFAIAFLATLLPGCRPTITCEDVPCVFGETCNTVSGECEPVVRSCTDDSGCRTGEVCDSDTNRCVPTQLQCTDRFTCPTSQVCNAQTGFCEPASQCSRDGCGPAETCNPTTERCEPSRCDDAEDCPTRFTCDDQTCILGCTTEEDCPLDEFCNAPAGAIGSCEPSCRSDFDCQFGRHCDDSQDPPICTPEPPCGEDADCRIDEVCLFGACAQPPCQSDDDCLETQICDTAIGQCLDVTCEEDVYGRGDIGAPNNSFENAAEIEVGDYRNLRLCRATEDWFRVRLRTTDIATLTVRSETDDLDLAVFDDQKTLLARDERHGQVSVVQFNPKRTGDVFITVTSQDRDAIEYNLDLSTFFCANDLFEENDSPETAKVVPSQPNTPVSLPLRACPGDEDWFRVSSLSPESGLRITPQANSTVDVTVVDPTGEVFAVSNEGGMFAPRVGVAGDYLISARSDSPAQYELRVEHLSPYDCPESQLHNTFESAVPENATVGSHTICPVSGGWETDWFQLPAATGLTDVRVAPGPDTPPIDIVLFRGANAETLVRTAANIDGIYSAVYEPEDGEVYWLRVSSDQPSERLMGIPTYVVSVDPL